MKAVILAGGFGTRISEETGIKPKPMVEIGDKPILWHIMKIYSAAGIDDFIICLGYKGYVIKEYFATYSLHMSDITFDLRRNDMQIHQDGHGELHHRMLVDVRPQIAHTFWHRTHQHPLSSEPSQEGQSKTAPSPTDQ